MKKPKKLEKWKKQLINTIANETQCNIQHNGCPCNTCFHNWANKHFGKELGHHFWEIILITREDYTLKQINEYNKIK